MSIKRVEQKAATKEFILSVARSLIKKKGIENTTIREIAKAARVANGTVFSHFPSKTDLFYELFYNDIEGFAKHALSNIEKYKTIENKLTHICHSFLNSYASDAKLYASFLELSLFAKGKWGKQFTRQVEIFGESVAHLYLNAIHTGELKKNINVPAAVGTFFSFYYMILISQIKSEFKDTDAGLRQFKAMVKLHLEGLQNEKN